MTTDSTVSSALSVSETSRAKGAKSSSAPSGNCASVKTATKTLREQLKVVAFCECLLGPSAFHLETVHCHGPWSWAVSTSDVDPEAPRVAFLTQSLAERGLRVLLSYDDAFLERMFKRQEPRFLRAQR